MGINDNLFSYRTSFCGFQGRACNNIFSVVDRCMEREERDMSSEMTEFDRAYIIVSEKQPPFPPEWQMAFAILSFVMVSFGDHRFVFSDAQVFNICHYIICSLVVIEDAPDGVRWALDFTAHATISDLLSCPLSRNLTRSELDLARTLFLQNRSAFEIRSVLGLPAV